MDNNITTHNANTTPHLIIHETMNEIVEPQSSLDHEWDEPIPLISESEGNSTYPVSVFPNIAKQAIIEYQKYGQQPLALVGSSTLASMSIACQGLADVARDEQLTSPISLNMLVIAVSGERKTAADNVFSGAVRAWELEQQKEHRDDAIKQQSLIDIHETKRRTILKEIAAAQASKSSPKTPIEQLEQSLIALDADAPSQSRGFHLLYEDINQQTLAVALAQGHPSVGLFSNEGGIVCGGNGMNNDNAIQFFAVLNKLWDGGTLKRDRLTALSADVRDKRISISIMLQHSILRELLQIKGGQSRDTGFLARFLIASPESTIGYRNYLPPQHTHALNRFNERIRTLLDIPLPLEDGEQQYIKPPLLHLSPEAKEYWVKFFDDIEAKSKTGSEYGNIQDVASKIADNAARIAAIFHVFEYGSEGEISSKHMEAAIVVAHWYLDEAKRVLAHAKVQNTLYEAETLLRWMMNRDDGNGITTTEISQNAPRMFRAKGDRKRYIDILVEHHYLRVSDASSTMYEINPRALALMT